MSRLQASRLLDSIEADFTADERHKTPAVDGTLISTGLDSRKLSFSELRDILLSESAEPELPDAIWRHVMTLARSDGGQELTVLWLMLPSLRRASRRIFARCTADRQEIESAMVFGVLARLRGLDSASTGVTATLRNAAYRHGYQTRKWIRKESPSEFIEYYVDQVQHEREPSWDEVGAPVPTAPENSRREGVRLGAIIQRLELFRPRCTWDQPNDGPAKLRRAGGRA